jgi:uncharacterized protein
MGNPFRIMALNGGGVRGILSLGLLARLSETLGGDALVANTSMFAGTSVGASLAAALAKGTSVDKLSAGFAASVIEIYGEKIGPPGPQYDIQKSINIQRKSYENHLLSSFSQRVVMTSFSVGADDVPWGPILFGNVPGITQDAEIVDAVVASGAMPGMLASYPWSGKYLVDGAFYNHDPSLAAIATAVSSGVPLEDIVLLDIGTGFMAEWIQSLTTTWGATDWETNQLQNTPPLLVGSDRKSPITNISLNGTSTTLTAHLAKMLLGDRCLSLNPPIKYVPEDAISELDYLWRAGTDFVDPDKVKPWLDRHWSSSAAAHAST